MAAPKDEALSLPELAAPPRVLLVVAPFYRQIADHLIAGAEAALVPVNARVERAEVPGALEIPTAIRLASRAGRFDGYVALGCVIRGETTHYETVCNDSSRGLTLLGLEGFCIGNGILTVETEAQAIQRADPGQLDKGGGAAQAALHLIALARRFAPGSDGLHSPEADILLAQAAQPRTG
ncbi:MAG: 6,7-dimethyl-8-ribityllumazine synthase [Pseudomonadota bacterium]